MKIITLIAMAAITLVAATGSIPEGSVGGAMTLAVIFLAAALAAGLYEAWSEKRGPLGWIVNILVSFFGGLLGAGLGSLVLEILLTGLQPEGSLVKTGHPLLYLSLNAQMLFTLAGAWAALQTANRMR